MLETLRSVLHCGLICNIHIAFASCRHFLVIHFIRKHKFLLLKFPHFHISCIPYIISVIRFQVRFIWNTVKLPTNLITIKIHRTGIINLRLNVYFFLETGLLVFSFIFFSYLFIVIFVQLTSMLYFSPKGNNFSLLEKTKKIFFRFFSLYDVLCNLCSLKIKSREIIEFYIFFFSL